MMGFIKDIFEKSKLSRNTKVKISAVLVAIVFWFYVMDQVNPEITRDFNDIPVVLEGVESINSSGLIISGEDSFYADVSVKGRWSDVMNLTEDDIIISADVRGYRSGLNAIPLTKTVSNEDVEIYSISRNDIKISIEQIVSMAKKVEVTTSGETSEGFFIGDVSLNVSEILVKGPENLVNQVSVVKGEVDVTDQLYSFSMDVPVLAYDAYGKYVSGVDLDISYVKTEVEMITEKELTIDPTLVGEVPDGYKLVSVAASPETVILRGVSDLLLPETNISTGDIDISDKKSSYKKEVELKLPEGAEILGEEPLLVYLDIRAIEAREYYFRESALEIENLTEGYEVIIQNFAENIILTVKNIREELSELSKDNMALYLDLQDLSPGTYELPIKVKGDFGTSETILSQENLLIEIILSDQE